ncbi:MAG: tetratricopeptide repeat protein [Dermatophilaceae bacterium]
MLRKGAVHELVGQWEEGEQDYRAALERAKSLNDWYLIGRSNRRLGQLLMLRGNYPEAKKHLDVADHLFRTGQRPDRHCQNLRQPRHFLFPPGQLRCRQKLVCQSHRDQPRQCNRDAENAAIVANLGLIFMNQGHYDEGIRWLEEQLDIAERAGR